MLTFVFRFDVIANCMSDTFSGNAFFFNDIAPFFFYSIMLIHANIPFIVSVAHISLNVQL